MRRSIIVLGAGALLLSSTACGSDSTSSAAPAAATSGAAVATSAAASPAAATPDAAETTGSAVPAGTESTKKVCANSLKLLEGKQMKKFGGELGKMIVYKQNKKTSQADAARASARKQLNTLAGQFEATTAKAKDPELQAAGQETADAIRETGKNNEFFAKIKSIKDVNKNLQSEIIPWVTPLSTFCS